MTTYEGEGKLVGPHKVQVTDPAGETKYYTAKHILIATGARAVTLNIPGRVSCFKVSTFTERSEVMWARCTSAVAYKGLAT